MTWLTGPRVPVGHTACRSRADVSGCRSTRCANARNDSKRHRSSRHLGHSSVTGLVRGDPGSAPAIDESLRIRRSGRWRLLGPSEGLDQMNEQRLVSYFVLRRGTRIHGDAALNTRQAPGSPGARRGEGERVRASMLVAVERLMSRSAEWGRDHLDG